MKPHDNYKNKLQEHFQKLGLSLPLYSSSVSGTDYVSCVTMEGEGEVVGTPRSTRKEAEMSAAKYGYNHIKGNKEKKKSKEKLITPNMILGNNISSPTKKEKKTKPVITIPDTYHVIIDADQVNIGSLESKYYIDDNLTAVCNKSSPSANVTTTFPLITIDTGIKDCADVAILILASQHLCKKNRRVIIISRDNIFACLRDLLATTDMGMKGRYIRMTSLDEFYKYAEEEGWL